MKNNRRVKKRFTEIITGKNYSGEASPYWEFMLNMNRNQGEGMNDRQEDPYANPDVLSEEDSISNRPLTQQGELQMQAVHETFNELTKQQQKIIRLLHEGVLINEKDCRGRCEQCVTESGLPCAGWGERVYTEQAIADALRITRDNVHRFLIRIKTKIRRRYEKLKAAPE